MLKLYGTPPTRALRVVWLLNELGLEHELHPVDLMQDEHHQQNFLSLNPAAKVPVLVDGDLVLTESAAIQLYLAEKYPQAGFIPETLEDRAQMYRWMFFLVTEVEQPLWRIARHTFVYPDEKRIPQDVELARQECLEMIEVLERHMSEREFMVGDRLSVADFNAAYTLDWANTEEMLAGAPRLRDYLKAMYARPTAPPTIAEAFAAMESSG
ncbi:MULTISPECIES: glutathione S-transferase family protein [Marinobacter]|jgi:glutathione S-transferase|uniref:glutathione S-transferase family protein n=1 Tax=Marinobacter TaxID=2742 RepID=UPI0009491C38|nr:MULTISPECIES: glutathione S-transferase family protein [Marinobacter]AZR40744.1 glutathione transferase [Marinobacter salarius]MCZ4284259.1 glutathione S-transferase family protein [Marinobacter salarius]MDC8454508.1 glutathione S-transferase family protein [Marinobacter sp. DS40M6]MDM8178865.1 glutathione S-transferase family protein [Marinobacter salarius]OLF83907.1 glutathione S-transferase [Marinobacter sp. C18]|tara:strand:+ start:5753 stop:6385 length:633 start_codon:yes stop_codon:yes gene_type:complete